MSYGSGSHRNTNNWSRSNTSSNYSLDNQVYPASGNVSYPLNKRGYSDAYGNNYSPHTNSSSKPKSVRGYVTRLYDSWGLIDSDCHFSFSVCSKGIPKMNDYVLADTIPSPNPQYKLKATRVQILNGDREFSNNKIPSNSRAQNDFDPRKRARTPSYGEKNRDRKYDDGDKKRFKRDDKEDRFKETFERDTHRDREKPKENERSPVRRRSRTPTKRRFARYAVKVPTELLNLSSGDLLVLKKRYPALYIPSDFFTSNFCWTNTFPLHKPFTLDKPCTFHVMHKDCDSIVENDAILEPSDLNYVFTAKVLLINIPNMDEIYKKSVCLAEDLHKEDERTYVHLTRLIQFLVGTRGKGEPLAIGGPWSPSLDGENPDKDPSVLINTAIRTCKALTGIDLSGCSQWYRFMEIYYHRSESVHKGKTIPARVETVVFFLPEVWNCVPTYLEWEDVKLNYKNLLEEKLQPRAIEDTASQTFHSDQTEESDKEEDLVVIDKCEEKLEPTPYTELDPNNMKVNELRQELEARSLSTKGLKPQLVERLLEALKKEENEDLEELEKSEGCLMEIDKVEDDKSDDETTECDKINDVSEEKKNSCEEMEDEKVVDEEVEDVKTEVIEPKVLEPIDRTSLEKKYHLPDTPRLIVHPSKTAKSGKFDCTVLSLASLLDYRNKDNKEHSFELYLCAELFHEMLQRDFGFSIYKKFCELPEKPKEEKDEKEKKEDKESTKSDKKETPDKDQNASPKVEDKSKKDDPESKKNDPETENNDCDAKPNGIKSENGGKCEESKKKERVKLITKDPHLLLSFAFFDRTHCGFIFDKDLETIIFALGLQLSRHQTRRLISKVTVRDAVHYRKLTDKPENEEDQEQNLVDADGAALSLGNRKFFPVFKEIDCKTTPKTSSAQFDHKSRASDSSASKPSCLVNVGGSIIDVEKVTDSLRKSECARLEVEKQLFKYKNDYDTLKEQQKKLLEKEKKINEDLQSCRDKLMSVNKEKITLMNNARTYHKLLLNIKDQINAVEEKTEKNSKPSKSVDKHEEKLSKSKIKKESSEDVNDKTESVNHHDDKNESTQESQPKKESAECSKNVSNSEKLEEDENVNL